MLIISFAWTTPAFLARRKSATRRDWDDVYAARFKPGDLVQAWDKTPRCRGAKRIGTIKIVSVKKESYNEVLVDDWEAEGFAYLDSIGAVCQLKPRLMTPAMLFQQWALSFDEDTCWVVRFEIVEVLKQE